MKTVAIVIGIYAIPNEYCACGYSITAQEPFREDGQIPGAILLCQISKDLQIDEGNLTGQLIDLVETEAKSKQTEAIERINTTKDRILEKLRTLPAPE